MIGFFKRSVMAATVLFAPAHALAIVLLCLAILMGHKEHWLVDAASYGLPVLLLLSVLHVPGAIMRRSPFLLSATAFPLLVFGVVYGPSYVPRASSLQTNFTFTVMSYNVWGGNHHFDLILDAIDDKAPDVVGLQEVNDRIAAEIKDDLVERYPYWAFDGDQAMFSRFPIVNHEVLLVGDQRAPIPVQHVDLDVNGSQIAVVNAHPHSPGLIASQAFGLKLGYPSGFANKFRDLEVREMMTAIEDIDGPLVVLGDFNLTDLQIVYGEMTQTLTDAQKEAGYGLGLTRTPLRGVGPALWRIDFIFYTSDLEALSVENGKFGGSDHRPVVAELAFRD